MGSRSIRVVYSPPLEDGNHYSFHGARGRAHWPKALLALGAGGAWNWAWRLGLSATEPERAASFGRDDGDLVLLHLGSVPDDRLIHRLEEREASGAFTIVTGSVPAISAVLGSDVQIRRVSLRSTQAFATIDASRSVKLHGPRSAEVFRLDSPGSSWRPKERLAAVGGERHTPERALIEPIEAAPAALVRGGTVVLNGEPFSCYQAWLQGHEDLQTWLAWRPRLSWLDHYAVDLCDLIERCVPDAFRHVRPVAVDLPTATLVLRHDLDNSRDTSMLETELRLGVPATHAVLLDRNTTFWLRKLSQAGDHEPALHYNTAREPSFVSRAFRRSLDGPPLSIEPDPDSVSNRGLARQVRHAANRGLHPRTLLRHLAFIYYPEVIDAFAALPSTVVGGSSFFRGHVLRFGESPSSVRATSMGDFPDTQFPSLFPFRPFDAGRQELLPLFDGTSVMEAEPELINDLTSETVPERALRRVIVAGYHPAHASTDTIRAGGTLRWLEQVIASALSQRVPLMTLATVFEKCCHSGISGTNHTQLEQK